MTFVDHMLLASLWILKLFGAKQAELTKMDSLSHISEKPFQIYKAVYVKNDERVLHSHMIQAFLHAVKFRIAK